MSNCGFYTSSAGRNQDTANALALCRVDRTLDQCRECVRATMADLLVLCQNRRQGAVWYEYCIVRYSNDPIHNIRIPYSLIILLTKSHFIFERRIARPPTTENGSSMIFALLQCLPDSLSEDCRKCLADLVNEMLGVVDIVRGVRMLSPDCIMRYELYSFYNNSRLMELGVLPPSPSPTENTKRKRDDNIKKIVEITTPIGVCLMAASVIIFLRQRMKRPRSREITENISVFAELGEALPMRPSSPVTPGWLPECRAVEELQKIR
ncbi:hypothetical protein C2S52_004345 [Perilla frutescens var. hirtella]|nr:hypothetical protein C2S52_004345 [Perilla frutescens var. hirtella]